RRRSAVRGHPSGVPRQRHGRPRSGAARRRGSRLRGLPRGRDLRAVLPPALGEVRGAAAFRPGSEHPHLGGRGVDGARSGEPARLRPRVQRRRAQPTAGARSVRTALHLRLHAPGVDGDLRRRGHPVAVRLLGNPLDHASAGPVGRAHRGPGTGGGRAAPRGPEPRHRLRCRRAADPRRGAAAVRLLGRGGSQALPVPGGRLLGAGLVGTGIVFAAELTITWFKLTGASPLDSVTGLLSLARLALLIALAVVLVQIRRRGARSLLLPAVLLIAWVAIGAAMTRIPPPQYFVPTSISQVFMGFDVPDAPTFSTLVGTMRLNLFFA